MIEVITTFKVNLGSEIKATLDVKQITALSIWLVEAINNPDVLPLHFNTPKFAWRHEDYIHFHNVFDGMDFLKARELVDKIESLIDEGCMLDDAYPAWNDHPLTPEGCIARYQVLPFHDGSLLGYIDTQVMKPILPIALGKIKDGTGWKVVEGKPPTTRPWHHYIFE